MIPKNLKFGSKVESAPARSIRSNIMPLTGSKFGLNEVIQINIPTRQNLVMVPTESYLKFKFRVRSTSDDNVFRFDSGGAHGLIQRIRVYHASNLLEDVDNYNLLTKMLHDVQIPTDSTYGKLAILEGTRPDMVLTTPKITAADGTDLGSTQALANALKTAINETNHRVQSVSTGDILKTAAGANLIAADTSTEEYTFCLNLVSLLGSLCSQNYLPLFAMTSAPLRLEIQLVDDLKKAMNVLGTYSTDPSLTYIDNVEFVAQMIELSDSAMSIISSSLGGSPLQFVIPAYKNYQHTASLPNGTTTQTNFNIAAKYSSLKSLFITQRDRLATASYFPLSSVTANIVDYQFRVGSVPVPAKAVNTHPEMFAELLKAIGSLSDITHQPSIEQSAYVLSASTPNSAALESNGASTCQSGSFYVGLNLENYEASSKDTIFAGWNSNTDDIVFISNYENKSGATINLRLDSFALYDSVLVCENNTAYVRF